MSYEHHIDREQRLQLKRAGTFGYQFAVKHRRELGLLIGKPEVRAWVSRSPEFVRGIAFPMGWDVGSQMAQMSRMFEAALAGVFRTMGRMGFCLLPF